MALAQLDELYQAIDRLTLEQKLLLLEHLARSLRRETQAPADESWGAAELRALLDDYRPMTGKAIVEAGLLGGWADLDIPDGAQWVAERRAKSKAEHAWR